MPAEPTAADRDRHTPGSDSSVAARLDGLRRSCGIEFPAARRVLTMLAAGLPLSVTELVEGAGLARRPVMDILDLLEVHDRHDGAVGLDPVAAAAVAGWLQQAPAAGGDGADPWDASARAPELVARLTELAAGLPPSRWRLDHVPATAVTMAKRALYLTETFALDGAHLLCVGDHDLTSLAVTLAEPRARATVVDIDERLLAAIERAARRHGLDVTCARADLRLGLPATLSGSADLAFTDPPYTPLGIELFVRRALQGLRRAVPSRVLFCYGFGDRTASRAVEIQELITRLGLAFEAIHPDFNAYRGAEAIGSRSHLYLARPTRASWPAVDRPRKGHAARIYTRGPEAEEVGETALSGATVAAVAGTLPGGPITLVGSGWADAALGPARRLGLDRYLERDRPVSGAVAVNLFPEFGAALVPTLLAAPADLTLVLSGEAWRAGGLEGGEGAAALLGAAFELTVVVPGNRRSEAVVRARRRQEPSEGPVAGLHRYLVTHRTARVVNAWREGLVHVAAAAGLRLTKNESRALVAGTAPGPSLERLSLGELSRRGLDDLAERSARSVRPIVSAPGRTGGSGGSGR